MVIGTVKEHVDSYCKYSKHIVVPMDLRGATQTVVDLDKFDALIFHYSVVISSPNFISANFAKRIREFTGTKILFIQDEYRWIDRTAAACKDLEIRVVFTVVNSEIVRAIYRDPWFDNVRFEQTLTGFVSDALCALDVRPFRDRPVDVAYRARRLSAALGSFGQEKWTIGERFRNDAIRYGLKCDISSNESDRLYGKAWTKFLANAKAVLGTESGSSICDFSGTLIPEVEAYEQQNPGASFDEIRNRFLNAQDQGICIRVISPRCFEAAALRTLMILYPGSYSGILQPWTHYVPLERDHSNMDEVVAVIRSPERATAIIERAYREIACSGQWSSRKFIEHFDRVIDEEVSGSHSSSLSSDDIEYYVHETRRKAKRYILTLRLALLVNKTGTSVQEFLSRTLPAPLPALSKYLGRRIYLGMKAVARRILI